MSEVHMYPPYSLCPACARAGAGPKDLARKGLGSRVEG